MAYEKDIRRHIQHTSSPPFNNSWTGLSNVALCMVVWLLMSLCHFNATPPIWQDEPSSPHQYPHWPLPLTSVPLDLKKLPPSTFFFFFLEGKIAGGRGRGVVEGALSHAAFFTRIYIPAIVRKIFKWIPIRLGQHTDTIFPFTVSSEVQSFFPNEIVKSGAIKWQN